jgi:hypothetical protein
MTISESAGAGWSRTWDDDRLALLAAEERGRVKIVSFISSVIGADEAVD